MTSAQRNPLPDFSDASSAYASATTPDLCRSWLSLSLCQWPMLVQHAPTLHRWSRQWLGDTLTDFALRQSFFGHFCGGVDTAALRPKIARLEAAGVGSILDYAAEDEGSPSMQATDDVARVYTYETEQQCDRHLATFQQCVKEVASLGKDGFAAVKVTALGNPLLLEKMSVAIRETQNLFSKFDKNQDGHISKAEFEDGCRTFFHDHRTLQEQLLQTNDDSFFRHSASGEVDYITWSMLLAPRHLPYITANCRNTSGPLAQATPTERELELMERMLKRGHALAASAAAHGTRLLMDAEQSRVQPAIDNLVLDLQRDFNSPSSANDKGDNKFPIVYNTYQCYLTDSLERLRSDVQRAERFSYGFGAKLVRGAYLESERQEAEERGRECPIHPTKEASDACYDAAVDYLLQTVAEKNRSVESPVELMLATHNQTSIETAIAGMNRYGIDRRDPCVSFGQLLGMMDKLTFGLGRNGYRAFKYVPYGEVKMVMPFLIRRANENSSLAGGAAQELAMIESELRRRLFVCHLYRKCKSMRFHTTGPFPIPLKAKAQLRVVQRGGGVTFSAGLPEIRYRPGRDYVDAYWLDYPNKAAEVADESVYLRGENECGAAPWGKCSVGSPIALDLDRSNAVEHIDGNFDFDLSGNGIPEELTEWFALTEGILVVGTYPVFGSGDLIGWHLYGDLGGFHDDGFILTITFERHASVAITMKRPELRMGPSYDSSFES